MEEIYAVVKKEEIEVNGKSDILVIDFSKDTTELVSNFKIEQKEVHKRKHETSSKYREKLDSLNKSYKDQEESFKSVKEEIEENYNKEIDLIEKEKESQNIIYLNAIKDLEEKYNVDSALLEKDLEKNVLSSNEDITALKQAFEEDMASLNTQLDNINKVHDEKMDVLNSDINAKIEALKEESNKNITIANEAILKGEEEYTKNSEDLKFEYDYSIKIFDKNHAIETEKYEALHTEIKETLDAKVKRHEKFMNRSAEHNDTRAVKQHKKEILILQKNAEKRLKDIELEQAARIKEYEGNKKQALKEYIEEQAKLDLRITEIRETEEFNIKSFEAKIENDLECIEFRIKGKIQEEMKRYNEEEKNHAISLAELILKHDTELETKLENQAKLHITFEKENIILKIKFEENVERVNKDIKGLEAETASKLNIAASQKEIELSKVNLEEETALKELEFAKKKSIELENAELEELDLIVKGETNGKGSSFKNDIHVLIETKEDFILAFEEDVLKDTSVTLKSLELQKATILVQKDTLTELLNAAYDSKVSSDDQTEDKEHSKDIEDIKENSLKMLEHFFQIEISRIDDLLKMIETELKDDIVLKTLRVFESSSLILLNAQLRNSKLSEESNVFEAEGVAKENAKIKELQTTFEKENTVLKASFDKIISAKNSEIKSSLEEKEKEISAFDQDLNKMVQNFNKQISEAETLELKGFKVEETSHKDAHLEAESTFKNEVKKVNGEYSQKESEYKSSTSKIEKESSVITKKLDLKNKLLKKEFDLSLSKKLKDINTKLIVDIKALQSK